MQESVDLYFATDALPAGCEEPLCGQLQVSSTVTTNRSQITYIQHKVVHYLVCTLNNVRFGCNHTPPSV